MNDGGGSDTRLQIHRLALTSLASSLYLSFSCEEGPRKGKSEPPEEGRHVDATCYVARSCGCNVARATILTITTTTLQRVSNTRNRKLAVDDRGTMNRMRAITTNVIEISLMDKCISRKENYGCKILLFLVIPYSKRALLSKEYSFSKK